MVAHVGFFLFGRTEHNEVKIDEQILGSSLEEIHESIRSLEVQVHREYGAQPRRPRHVNVSSIRCSYLAVCRPHAVSHWPTAPHTPLHHHHHRAVTDTRAAPRADRFIADRKANKSGDHRAVTRVLGQPESLSPVSASDGGTLHSCHSLHRQTRRQTRSHRARFSVRSEILRVDNDVAARTRPAAVERTIMSRAGGGWRNPAQSHRDAHGLISAMIPIQNNCFCFKTHI